MSLQDVSNGIIKVLKPRFMFQYKKSEWPNKLALEILPILERIDKRSRQEIKMQYSSYISPKELSDIMVTEGSLIENRWIIKMKKLRSFFILMSILAFALGAVAFAFVLNVWG